MTTSDANLCSFPGRDRLIAAVDDAVLHGGADRSEITRHLRDGLCALMKAGSVELPDCVFQTVPGHYARRELYRSRRHGYGVVAMTWAPGQGTKIHDHHGMWCVEGVWSGNIEITQYDLAEREGDEFRFVECNTLTGNTGSAGCLIPPHEYHTIRNASDRDVAVSVHIYEQPMTCCGLFEQSSRGDGWHRYVRKELTLDAAA
ncbi:cysteine dioxygenase family protein [Solilutibacter silvestris]|uniref:Cysteine dioxygenase type I n=1 Tax=Solilutibacter silvestris TaxID=1645665 RepID=A0A2K1PZN0_9GAMM|nr:cysteine dioxygenase family protein [Lysobacter silvestris]PNS08239.1 Cysteine dioxygenase type I [Lysobacter silvestris]